MEAYTGGGPATGWSDVNLHPTAYASTIWLDASVLGGTKTMVTTDLSAAFHTYALKWEANKQTFYFDGVEVYTANATMADPMYIMLDLWFGSASGLPDSTTPVGIANSFEVNYVRAWRFI
jgi:beta-glucanase (GH16 family)